MTEPVVRSIGHGTLPPVTVALSGQPAVDDAGRRRRPGGAVRRRRPAWSAACPARWRWRGCGRPAVRRTAAPRPSPAGGRCTGRGPRPGSRCGSTPSAVCSVSRAPRTRSAVTGVVSRSVMGSFRTVWWGCVQLRSTSSSASRARTQLSCDAGSLWRTRRPAPGSRTRGRHCPAGGRRASRRAPRVRSREGRLASCGRAARRRWPTRPRGRVGIGWRRTGRGARGRSRGRCHRTR